MEFIVSPDFLALQQLYEVIEEPTLLKISEASLERVKNCRLYLDEKLKQTNKPLYGINTGFGSLYSKNISGEDLEKLQENLVKSHACGTGAEIDSSLVRLMLLLKVQSLAYGHSGVQVNTLERLVDLFNAGIYPVIYQQGSLGASGDLAPLAHLALPLMGLGEVYFRGEKVPAASLIEKLGWEPIRFKAKEGLALLNGTQFMSALGLWSIYHAEKLNLLADIIGALSLDTFDGRLEPFDAQVQNIRPHQGQEATAQHIRQLLHGSELIVQPKQHVQDPYSFRCMPQVHGASKDTLQFVKKTFETEINSVSDNPNIFPQTDDIISAGNFHGQPLALGLDFLSISLAELGSISERRTYQLISGLRELPPYLVANPGLHSGLMIPQYTAASIASQNKQLCTPASVDSIVSSNGQEDHVSMGANAATKTIKVVDNLYTLLAIELLTAAQALDFRKPLTSSPTLMAFCQEYRQLVPFIEEDRILHEDIQTTIAFLKGLSIASVQHIIKR